MNNRARAVITVHTSNVVNNVLEVRRARQYLQTLDAYAYVSPTSNYEHAVYVCAKWMSSKEAHALAAMARKDGWKVVVDDVI